MSELCVPFAIVYQLQQELRNACGRPHSGEQFLPAISAALDTWDQEGGSLGHYLAQREAWESSPSCVCDG